MVLFSNKFIPNAFCQQIAKYFDRQNFPAIYTVSLFMWLQRVHLTQSSGVVVVVIGGPVVEETLAQLTILNYSCTYVVHTLIICII